MIYLFIFCDGVSRLSHYALALYRDCTLCYAWRFQSQLSYLLANSCTSWCIHIQASLCWYHVFYIPINNMHESVNAA